ncbi:hypothetical protein DFQ27_007232 [Actinomortierella ambigua]|uniref:Uncharacterized protein n=1 Tax=Actinomortierella ambigua TaxID=1343610 RepID=A0A9P6QGL6_9FUNG|nr:hypothetical protein DFQ27_007232 [Actinomortierella ambigua]
MASPSRSRLPSPSSLLNGFGILSHRRTTSNNNNNNNNTTLADDAQEPSQSLPGGGTSGSGESNNNTNSGETSNNALLSSSVQPTLSPLRNSTSSFASSAFGSNNDMANKNSTSSPYFVGGHTSGAFLPTDNAAAAAATGESHRRLLNAADGTTNDDPRMGISGSGVVQTVSGAGGGGVTLPMRPATSLSTTTVTTGPGEVVERGSSRSSLALSPASSSSDQQPLAPHQHHHQHHVHPHTLQQQVQQQQTEGAPVTSAGQQPQQQPPPPSTQEQQQQQQQPNRPTSPSTTKRQGRSSTKKQTLLTKALLTYLKVFRIVQPLVSLGTLGTMLPVLLYFRTQTLFPAIQASLYLYTVTLACASFLFAVIYLVDVLYHKPLFWPFTNKHFRQTSKARIGGDLMICMAFCGMWFLSLVGLVIDAAMVDCGKLASLDRVFVIEDRSTGAGTYREDTEGMNRFHRICQLEKASMGLAVVCWACWMGVLLVLLYGHFWKRRQVIAERLRRSLSRRHARSGRGQDQHSQEQHPHQQHHHSSQTGGVDAIIKAGSIHSHRSATTRAPGEAGAGVGSSSSNGGGGGVQYDTQRSHVTDHCGCQHEDGEVGLTGIICQYDGDSLRGRSSLRSLT